MNHVEEALGGLPAALRHVHVRIGLVTVQESRVTDHGRGDVGVEVQGHRHRQGRSGRAAHRGQQITLTVIQVLGHHGPVQIEQDPVEGTGRLQVGQHPVLHRLVDILSHPAGRRGGCGHRRQEGESTLLGHRDHPTQTGTGAAVGLQNLAAVTKITGLELPAVRGDGAERVGLVRDHGHEDAHATS